MRETTSGEKGERRPPRADEGVGASRLSARARRERIAATTVERGFCSVAELSELFHVSDMTIRRDVAELAARGRLRQVFGGVTRLDTQEMHGTNYSLRLAAHRLAKSAIGRRAAKLVEPGAVVAIDSGSTALAVCAGLLDVAPLTVVTASWSAIAHCKGCSEIELVALGGTFHEDLQAFAGPLTLLQVEQIRVNLLFLGASGVAQQGVYCANEYDAVTKRALIRVADKVVLVADSAKFGSGEGMLRVATLGEVDIAIVDSGLPADAREYMRELGTRLVEVDPEPGEEQS